MPPPRIVHSDEIVRLSTWQNLAITDLVGEMDVLRIKRVARAVRELLVQFPSGIVTCAFIREHVPVGSKESREESARFMKDLGDSCLKMVVVIEQRGVMAQMLRTVVRGMNMITRNSKLLVLGETREAIDALAPLVVPPQAGANVTVELRKAIATVREGYGRAPHAQVAQR